VKRNEKWLGTILKNPSGFLKGGRKKNPALSDTIWRRGAPQRKKGEKGRNPSWGEGEHKMTYLGGRQ